MCLFEGEKVIWVWLKGVNCNVKKYVGEFGVVMGVEWGEVDVGFVNYYYILCLKFGKFDVNVVLVYIKNDVGCLVNVLGIVVLSDGDLLVNFICYLFIYEV